MDFTNILKRFEFKNLKFQFSYYKDGETDEILTIQPFDINGEKFISNEINKEQVERFVLDNFINGAS